MGSPESYFSWGVSSVYGSVTAFTAPIPETVFVNMAIDIDWQQLACYAVLRAVDPESFGACLEAIRLRGVVINSLDRSEMEELLARKLQKRTGKRL